MYAFVVLDFNVGIIFAEARSIIVSRQEVDGLIGEKDMADVAAVHHSLCGVDSFSCHVLITVNVFYKDNTPAMNPHADFNFIGLLGSVSVVIYDGLRDLFCTAYGWPQNA